MHRYIKSLECLVNGRSKYSSTILYGVEDKVGAYTLNEYEKGLGVFEVKVHQNEDFEKDIVTMCYSIQ